MTTPSEYSVSTQLSASTFSISTPAVTPSMPSYLPPVGRMSRCEPANVGGASLRRPDRTAKILAIASMVVWQPSAWIGSMNQSRTLVGVGKGQAAHACFGGCTLRSRMLAMSFFSGIYSRTLRLFSYIIRSYKDWASLYKEIEVMRPPHPILYPTGTCNVYPP